MRRAIGLALAAVCCTACSSMHAAPRVTSADDPGVQVFPVAQRTPAPLVQGTTLTGASFDLARMTGHGVVAVNVWASWCGPCRQEMPVLAQASRAGLHVVGIDERDHGPAARSFARSRGATYPMLADPDGRLLARLRMLPQTGVPSTVFLDSRGRVAARVVGPIAPGVLRRLVRRLGGT